MLMKLFKDDWNESFRSGKKVQLLGISILVIISILILYVSTISEHPTKIKNTLISLSADSLTEMIILPKYPDWKINLTLNPIRIIDKKTIIEITNVLNNLNSEYHGRIIPKGWEAYLVLNFKGGNEYLFEVIDAEKGIALVFTKTMFYPKYKCNGLKNIFEHLANYKENLGKEKHY